MPTSIHDEPTLKMPGTGQEGRGGTGRDSWQYLLVGIEEEKTPSETLNVSVAPSGEDQLRYLDDDSAQVQKRKAQQVVRRPQWKDPASWFDLLQQWEGVVSDVGEETFIGVIRDLTTPQSERERVELELADVSPSDRDLLCPGAVFYWSIGYEHCESGQILRVSSIRLQRSPRWSKRRLAQSEKRAGEMTGLLGTGAE